MNNNPKQPKKVLICITNIEIGGGAEKVAVTVGNKFLKRGIDTTLLTFYTIDREHTFDGKRISMHEATPASVFGKLPRAWTRIWKVRKVCKEEKIDLVISFLEESNYYVLLSKLLLFNRTPMIVSVRNDPRHYNWLYKLLIRVLYPFAALVVPNSKWAETALREDFGLKKVTTIYNPIDLDLVKRKAVEPVPKEFSWLEAKKPLCITIGRLAKQKGQWHLVRAFTEVVKQIPEANLAIIGGGVYEEKLQQLIIDCGLEKNVHLLGKHNNVYQFLSHADLFVFSSLWEGLPNTVIEARAVALPVVATDCEGGTREIVAPETLNKEIIYPYENENGALTKPFDGEEIWQSPAQTALTGAEVQFANTLIKMLLNNQTHIKFIAEHRFSQEKVIDEWLLLLETI